MIDGTNIGWCDDELLIESPRVSMDDCERRVLAEDDNAKKESKNEPNTPKYYGASPPAKYVQRP